MGGVGEWSCWQSDLLLNTEDGKGNGVWSTLVMEKGILWYVGEVLLFLTRGGAIVHSRGA